MIPRNARLRRRLLILGGIFSFGLALLVAAVVYLRLPEQGHELAQAHALLRQAEHLRNAPGVPPSEKPQEVHVRELLRKINAQELPGNTRNFLFAMRLSPPWFPDYLLAKDGDPCKYIDELRGKDQLTPEDEALDPRTHSADEIRSTICSQVRQSESLKALRQACNATGAAEPRVTWWEESGPACRAIQFCVTCALAEDKPEEAAAAYLDSLAAIRHSPTPATEIIGPGRFLVDIINAFPGPLPEETADQLLAALDIPFDPAPLRRDMLLLAASRIGDEAARRSQMIKDAWDDDIIFHCIASGKDNLFQKLREPSPAERILKIARRAMDLAESPPYLVRKESEALRASVPASATNTLEVLETIENFSVMHHRFVATLEIARTVIALKRYKGDHGQYPASLDELTPDPIPALPIEPVTGQPLRYAVEGDGFGITSPADLSTAQRVPIWKTIDWHAKR